MPTHTDVCTHRHHISLVLNSISYHEYQRHLLMEQLQAYSMVVYYDIVYCEKRVPNYL